jgi:hypothetical protein
LAGIRKHTDLSLLACKKMVNRLWKKSIQCVEEPFFLWQGLLACVNL